MPNDVEDAVDTLASEQWFICKRDNSICEIIKSTSKDEITDAIEIWGALASQGDAIAKRVGLIRSGKCQPL
ncbi:MAG: DDE transposase family protein [Pseudanabaena sp.]|jgi:hypothetical protein